MSNFSQVVVIILLSFFILSCNKHEEIIDASPDQQSVLKRARTSSDPVVEGGTLPQVIVYAERYPTSTVTFTGYGYSGQWWGYYGGSAGNYYGNYNGGGTVSDRYSYYHRTYQEDPYAQFRKQWDHLTPAEQALLSQHGSKLPQLHYNRQMAERQTILRFSNNSTNKLSMRNGRGDAFRHAFFNALNVRNFDQNYPGFTKALGDAHENFTGNDPLEKQMDLFNNSVGIRISMENPYMSLYELEQRIYQELLNGGLREMRNGMLVPTGPGPGEIDPGNNQYIVANNKKVKL